MVETEDDFDEDIEAEEEAAEEEEQQEAKKKPVQKQDKKAKQPEGIKERYTAIHQKESIFIIDNLKETIVADNFKDLGTAAVSALILNNQDRLLISSGA